MTAAIALAIVLVIAVAGASMAMESQRAAQPAAGRPPRPPRTPPAERPPRRPARGRGRPDPTAADIPASVPIPMPEPEFKGPDLLRTGTEAHAKVISVVDERTIGPVTRSRLVLRIEPQGAEALEVTVRHAFPTPELRASVKVGATVPVRYDADEPRRVVIDLPQG